MVRVVGEALVTKATVYGVQGRIIESRLLLESVIDLAKGENLTELALRAYLNLGAVIPEGDLKGDPTLQAIELGRSVGNLNFTLLASTNRAGYLMGRAQWDEAEKILLDPLWLTIYCNIAPRSLAGPLYFSIPSLFTSPVIIP